MSTQDPMTQEQLDAIKERLDAVEVDPPDEYWSYGAGIAWVPFCEHARTDIPAPLAEVQRLRALTTVDRDMVERAAQAMCDIEVPPDQAMWDKLDEDKRDLWRIDARAALDAALSAGGTA